MEMISFHSSFLFVSISSLGDFNKTIREHWEGEINHNGEMLNVTCFMFMLMFNVVYVVCTMYVLSMSSWTIAYLTAT